MSEQEHYELLVNDLPQLGLVFDITSNRSLKEILQQVSNDKCLYKKVCEVRKSYQRLQQQNKKIEGSDSSLEPLKEQLNHIFNKWE